MNEATCYSFRLIDDLQCRNSKNLLKIRWEMALKDQIMGCHQKKKKKSFAAATLIKLSISGEEALRLGIKLDYGL